MPPQSGQASYLGVIVSILARQLSGKWTARGLARSLAVQRDGGWLDRQRFGGGLVRFEIFEPQFELFDVAIALLRARAELHALEFEDEQLQILDLGVAGIEFGLLSQHQRFQRLQVEQVEIERLFLSPAHRVHTANMPRPQKPMQTFL